MKSFFLLLFVSLAMTGYGAGDGDNNEWKGAGPSLDGEQMLSGGGNSLSEVNQQGQISGTVIDDAGEPVIGATVLVKGTTNGTITDINGRFTVNVAAGTELEISFIGYATQTVKAANNLRVTLSEDTQQIEEVVVIGYGTVRKSDLTGSIVSLSNKKFRDLPQGGATQILQGKAAGVNITSTSGAGNTNIRIRGITSLNKSSEPLWVVDGVIGGVTGNFYDIESIEVLKDASSTAIYGSQGANGVILVTTKKAAEGKARVTFDARYGWSTLRTKPDLMSPYEFANAYNDVNGAGAISDEDVAAYKAGTMGVDWFDLMTQTGFGQSYNLNITGGSKASRYSLSAWGSDSKGQIVTITSKSWNVKATLDNEIAPWFSIHSYLHGSISKSHNGNDQNQFVDLLDYSPCMRALTDPVTGVYYEDMYSSLGSSPLGQKYAKYKDGDSNSMTGFTDLRFKIIDGLTLSIQGLYSRSNSVGREHQTSKLYPSAPNWATQDASQSYSLRNINNLTYQKDFGDHRLTAMGVLETTKYEWSNVLGRGRSFSLEQVGYWNLAAAETKEAESGYSNSGMISAFGRILYSYKGKYSFTGTYRADAPSQFRDKYKWGYFPSAAVAWNIAEEDFMNKDLIQQLKLRASVGNTGNHGVGAYSTLVALTRDNGSYGLNQEIPGFWLNKFTNPDIHWEKTTQYDIGVDAGILNQRVNLTVDWFLKNTTDLLFEKDMPLYNGGGKIWTNLGEMKNEGVEVTLNATPVAGKDLTWESTFTTTYTKNTIVNLAGEDRIIPDATRGSLLPGGMYAMEPGRPVGTFYLYDWVGFDDKGANLYRTADGGTTINPSNEDRIITGNPYPRWTFGWDNSLRWKNWDLNVFFRATGAADRLNIGRYAQTSKVGASKFITSREAYFLSWDKVADKSRAEFPSLTNADNKYWGASTQWLENAQFLRLQNLTIGYLIPKTVSKFADVHLSLSGGNLFVLSKYHGMDPETVSEVEDKYRDTTFGLDNGSFPIPRTFTFILRLDF